MLKIITIICSLACFSFAYADKDSFREQCNALYNSNNPPMIYKKNISSRNGILPKGSIITINLPDNKEIKVYVKDKGKYIREICYNDLRIELSKSMFMTWNCNASGYGMYIPNYNKLLSFWKWK